MDLYDKAKKKLAEATREGRVPRITIISIRNAVSMSETTFRSFQSGKHPDGSEVGSKTIAKHSKAIISAIEKLERQGNQDNILRHELEKKIGVTQNRVQNWATEHRGSYLCFRFASSGGLIQISRLSIEIEDDKPYFSHTFRISNPNFGEGQERIYKGAVFPVKGGAHLLYTANNQLHLAIFSDCKGYEFQYMVGINTGMSTDRRYAFSARIIAVRYSTEPEASVDLASPTLQKIPMSEIESQRASVLDVVTKDRLPKISELLSKENDPGLLRAELPEVRLE